jgi:hypothetical protein
MNATRFVRAEVDDPEISPVVDRLCRDHVGPQLQDLAPAAAHAQHDRVARADRPSASASAPHAWSRPLDDRPHLRFLRAVTRLDHTHDVLGKPPGGRTALPRWWRIDSLESRAKGTRAECAERDANGERREQQQARTTTHVHWNTSAFTRPFASMLFPERDALVLAMPSTALRADGA